SVLSAAGAGRASPRASQPPARSLELVGDLVDAGLRADLVLLAAGRAGDADRADDLLADLDRQRPPSGNHVVEMNREVGGVLLDALDDLARGNAEGARRVGLAQAVLHGVRRGAVAAYRDQNLAAAADHVHGDAMALLRAGLE